MYICSSKPASFNCNFELKNILFYGLMQQINIKKKLSNQIKFYDPRQYLYGLSGVLDPYFEHIAV